MAKGAPTEIGPWPAGIVNTVDDHAIPKTGLLDALDHNIDRDGHATARNTYDLLDANAYSDIFELDGNTYAVSQGAVGLVTPSAFEAIRAVDGPVGWTSLQGKPVYCAHDGVYLVEGLSATQFVLRDYVDDERRYGLTTMPGGHKVAYWQGRLLVLRGRSLLWSEALDYGSHSPARNFVRFRTKPTWMAPLADGIFVGLRDEVVYLAGTDPADFKMRNVAGLSSPGSGVVVPNTHFNEDDSGQRDLALWFGEVGFVVGRADGSVIYPQAETIRDLPVVPRNLAIIDERVYAFTTEE